MNEKKFSVMIIAKDGHRHAFTVERGQEYRLLKEVIALAEDENSSINWQTVWLFVKTLREKEEQIENSTHTTEQETI